jgi:hypothetical protein
MPSLVPASLRIGLSRRTLTLLRVERRWRGQSASVLADLLVAGGAADGTSAHEPLMSALRAALKTGQCRRMPARIVLADELVRYFLVTPPKNAGSLHDCRAAAQMRFQSLYGEPATQWQIEADWDAVQPFLACALPVELLQALQAVLAEQQLAFAELAPRFVATWNLWRGKLQRDAWLGVAHERGMTVGAIHDGRLHAVRHLDASLGSLRDVLAREALLLNLPMPARLQLAGAAHDAVATADGALAFEHLDQPCAERTISPGLLLARTGLRT